MFTISIYFALLKQTMQGINLKKKKEKMTKKKVCALKCLKEHIEKCSTIFLEMSFASKWNHEVVSLTMTRVKSLNEVVEFCEEINMLTWSWLTRGANRVAKNINKKFILLKYYSLIAYFHSCFAAWCYGPFGARAPVSTADDWMSQLQMPE